MNQSVTLVLDEIAIDTLIEHYKDYQIANNGEYIIFRAKKNDVVITIYSSASDTRKITFIGEDPLKEARLWDKKCCLNVSKQKEKEHWLFMGSQIGSDEVGVGDFVLPMIVVAAYIDSKDIQKLIKLGIHDSKKLDDKYILSVGPTLIKLFKFSKLTINNEKYNEMILKKENLNSIKAKMHNRALSNMSKLYPDIQNIFVDQFVNEKKYYFYLRNGPDTPLKGITFKTKGESYYPSIALASVVARYYLLIEKQKLEDKYHIEFPFGANQKVDEFVNRFIACFGLEEAKKIAKSNFSNWDRIE